MQRVLERARRIKYLFWPRFQKWQFWIVQALVAIIAGLHYYGEIEHVLGYSSNLRSLSFVHVSLFFIPLVYAALNFGRAGTIATALLIITVTIPNIVSHSGATRIAEILNLSLVCSVAVLVGQRVDRETEARHRAESTGMALGISEAKYRGLFKSSPVAILLLDSKGVIHEANPASGSLFEIPPDKLRGMSVSNLVGEKGAEALLDERLHTQRNQRPIVFVRGDHSEEYLIPQVTRTSDQEGNILYQALLRNVTAERRRQAGMRAYAAHIQHVQEEERKRIAHELHDDLVQSLIMLSRRLDKVQSEVEICFPSAADRVAEARKSTEDTVARLRNFARALRPTILEDLGLVMAVRRLLVDLGEEAGIQGQLQVSGQERRLSPDSELSFFRIVQETLRNVVSHSKATEVTATISFAPHEVALEVLDNGVGFRPPHDLGEFAASGHLGLLGMQERAELMDGRLEIQSTPGKGTRIYISVPANKILSLAEVSPPLIGPQIPGVSQTSTG